jgi:hypothetical protein
MHRSEAVLKVLITHCCYSRFMSALGDADGDLRGVLNGKYNGTCLLTVVNTLNLAKAKGCENPELPRSSASARRSAAI